MQCSCNSMNLAGSCAHRIGHNTSGVHPQQHLCSQLQAVQHISACTQRHIPQRKTHQVTHTKQQAQHAAQHTQRAKATRSVYQKCAATQIPRCKIVQRTLPHREMQPQSNPGCKTVQHAIPNRQNRSHRIHQWPDKSPRHVGELTKEEAWYKPTKTLPMLCVQGKHLGGTCMHGKQARPVQVSLQTADETTAGRTAADALQATPRLYGLLKPESTCSSTQHEQMAYRLCSASSPHT